MIDEVIPPKEIVQKLAETARSAVCLGRTEASIIDYKTRLAALQTLLLHRRGRPAEAAETAPEDNGGSRTREQVLADLRSNPDALAALREMLDDALKGADPL